jgi:hypothetical protein
LEYCGGPSKLRLSAVSEAASWYCGAPWETTAAVRAFRRKRRIASGSPSHCEAPSEYFKVPPRSFKSASSFQEGRWISTRPVEALRRGYLRRAIVSAQEAGEVNATAMLRQLGRFVSQ